jgi:hypothetical protein
MKQDDRPIKDLLPAPPGFRAWCCYIYENTAEFEELPFLGWALTQNDQEPGGYHFEPLVYDNEMDVSLVSDLNFQRDSELIGITPPGVALSDDDKKQMETDVRRRIKIAKAHTKIRDLHREGLNAQQIAEHIGEHSELQGFSSPKFLVRDIERALEA